MHAWVLLINGLLGHIVEPTTCSKYFVFVVKFEVLTINANQTLRLWRIYTYTFECSLIMISSLSQLRKYLRAIASCSYQALVLWSCHQSVLKEGTYKWNPCLQWMLIKLQVSSHSRATIGQHITRGNYTVYVSNEGDACEIHAYLYFLNSCIGYILFV